MKRILVQRMMEVDREASKFATASRWRSTSTIW